MAEIPNQNKFLGPKPPLPLKLNVSEAASVSKPVPPPNPQVLPQAKTPMKQRPSTPIPAKPAENETIIIHTMKDDLANLAQSKPQAASGTKFVPDLTVKSTSSSPQAFPLPAKGAPGKSVVMPTIPKKPRYPFRIILFTVIALIVLIAGGIGIWYVLSSNAPAPVSQTLIDNPEELLPGNAISITEYKFDVPEKRQLINALRPQDIPRQPSLTELLEGNPQLILNDPDSKDIFYINIPQEPRPYVLIRKTKKTESIFTQPTVGVVTEKNGWYIAHQVSVESYLSALKGGTLLGSNKIQTFPDSYAVRIYLNQEALTSITESLGKGQLPASVFKEATLISDLEDVQDGKIALHGVAIRNTPQASTISTVDPTMLNFLPSEVEFLHVGHSLAVDIANNVNTGRPAIDQLISAEPAVKEFFSQLTEQYIYYHRTNGINSADIGLIVRLPQDLKDSLVIGDSTLEHSLFTLTPLITAGRQANALTFNDGAYEDIPLRYVNVGGPTQAIDYAIYDDYLLIATSKDGMFSLLKNVKAPSATSDVLTQLANLLAGDKLSQIITAASLDELSLKYIFPGINSTPKAAVGLKTLEGGGDAIRVQMALPIP